MKKYVRVMDENKSNAGGFEYKIGEINFSNYWNPKETESKKIKRPLTKKEVEALFRNFENLALWKPLIQRGRIKMASRDMALRDAFHYQ